MNTQMINRNHKSQIIPTHDVGAMQASARYEAELAAKNVNQGGILSRLNGLLSIERFLYLFWGSFWLLNGLDKFFNGMVVDGQNVGWFGVTRDATVIAWNYGSMAPS